MRYLSLAALVALVGCGGDGTDPATIPPIFDGDLIELQFHNRTLTRPVVVEWEPFHASASGSIPQTFPGALRGGVYQSAGQIEEGYWTIRWSYDLEAWEEWTETVSYPYATRLILDVGISHDRDYILSTEERYTLRIHNTSQEPFWGEFRRPASDRWYLVDRYPVQPGEAATVILDHGLFRVRAVWRTRGVSRIAGEIQIEGEAGYVVDVSF